jgi:hypothetical protein
METDTLDYPEIRGPPFNETSLVGYSEFLPNQHLPYSTEGEALNFIEFIKTKLSCSILGEDWHGIKQGVNQLRM